MLNLTSKNITRIALLTILLLILIWGNSKILSLYFSLVLACSALSINFVDEKSIIIELLKIFIIAVAITLLIHLSVNGNYSFNFFNLNAILLMLLACLSLFGIPILTSNRVTSGQNNINHLLTNLFECEKNLKSDLEGKSNSITLFKNSFDLDYKPYFWQALLKGLPKHLNQEEAANAVLALDLADRNDAVSLIKNLSKKREIARAINQQIKSESLTVLWSYLFYLTALFIFIVNIINLFLILNY